MADKATQALLNGLEKALAEPAGLPLHGGRGDPGLFPAGAGGKQAAQRGVDEGHLHVVRGEAPGKSGQPLCKLTDKGLNYLLSQLGTNQVLEDLVRAVEARQTQAVELLQNARLLLTALDGLKAAAQKVLAGAAPTAAWSTDLLAALDRWRGASSEDCPLPELFRQLLPTYPELTIGQFHDGLRGAHDAGQVYLHPWTGPLYALPEPPFALLIGHEVAYYASKR